MKNTAHIVVDSDGIHCNHCSEGYTPWTPEQATDYAERLLGYVRMHRPCPQPAERSPQLPIPGTEEVDLFAKMYPFPRDHSSLRGILHHVLTSEQYAKLPHGTVEGWPLASVAFDAIASWARHERARKEAATRAQRGEAAVPGLTIPGRFPVPKELAELLGEKEKAGKKASKRKA